MAKKKGTKAAETGVVSAIDKQSQDVVEWMLDGLDGHEILTRLVDAYPLARVDDVMKRAAEHFEGVADPRYHQMLKGWALEATRYVYEKLIAAGDYPNALRAIKQLREMIE